MPILKNAHIAIIEERKVRGYVLNPNHPLGAHKARVFRAALGYSRSNYAGLIEKLREAILIGEAVFIGEDRHGHHYRATLMIEGPKGTAPVRTGWIYDRGSDVPRLTTAVVVRRTD